MKRYAGIFVILLFFCVSIYPVVASGPNEGIRCETGTGVQIIDESDDTQDDSPQDQEGSGYTQDTRRSGTDRTTPAIQKEFQKNTSVPLQYLTNDTAMHGTILTREDLVGIEGPNASVILEIQAIKERVRKERDAMELELSATPVDQQYRIRKTNDFRCAILTLLAMENLTGDIGPSVSAIAGEINTSARSSWQQEEKIQNRNGIIRMLLGGDFDAADTIIQDTTSDRLRIRSIRELMTTAILDENLHDMMLEQVYTIEQEQERLETVAHKEKERRGWLSGQG